MVTIGLLVDIVGRGWGVAGLYGGLLGVGVGRLGCPGLIRDGVG